MAVYTIQDITEAGAVPSYTAVTASDTIAPGDSGQPLLLHVKNAGASPDTVVIDSPNLTGPVAAVAYDPDQTMSVTNGTEKVLRINPLRTKNTGTGNITVTHSFTTSVTAAVFRMP